MLSAFIEAVRFLTLIPLPSAPAQAVLVVVAISMITSGLHLDRLMSWRPRKRKLEIMKDSRIGAMGALALIAVFALKVVFTAAAGEGWPRAVLLATALGRCLQHLLPAGARGRLGPLLSGLCPSSRFCPMGLLVAQVLATCWTHTLGGLTGDTYGALCEIGEVVALAALSALR